MNSILSESEAEAGEQAAAGNGSSTGALPLAANRETLSAEMPGTLAAGMARRLEAPKPGTGCDKPNQLVPGLGEHKRWALVLIDGETGYLAERGSGGQWIYREGPWAGRLVTLPPGPHWEFFVERAPAVAASADQWAVS
jgi:hypothetical protein